MKVKFANRIYEVLFTKELAGLTMYAVEDEPNHIDWLINVDVVDAEKKELKKIEQKPVIPLDENGEPILTDFEAALFTTISYFWQSYNMGEEVSIAEFAKEYAPELLEAANKQQKQKWSEEDKEMLDGIIADVEVLKEQDRTKSGKAAYQKEIDWLKNLKDRIQPKQEWSEEDKKKYCNTIELLEDMKVLKEKYDLHPLWVEQCDEAISWLKSLRPPYYCDNCKLKKSIQGWKPSDEQMKALKEACDEHWEPDGLDPLYTLWEQLKKLREE